MNDEPSTQWEACPTGELQKLAKRLRRQRLDRARAKVIGLAGAAVIVVLAGGIVMHQFFATGRDPHSFGGITCAEVQANIQPYVAGQLGPQLANRIRIHLAQCPECGPPFRRMMMKMKQQVSFRRVSGSEPVCPCRG